MDEVYVICGKKAICEAVGENEKSFNRLRSEGLEAFRLGARGQWKLLPEDARAFLRKQKQCHQQMANGDCSPN